VKCSVLLVERRDRKTVLNCEPYYNSITRALYGAARLSNNLRVAGSVMRGHPETLANHIRNRGIMRVPGKLMRQWKPRHLQNDKPRLSPRCSV
jgi:hypothetical protein